MSVKHSLLALLSDAPATASALQQAFADYMQGLWPLNIGQVSQTLARLHRDGLIEDAGTTTGPTGRKAELYSITQAGREELAQWWNSATHRPANDRDELVMKVAIAAIRCEVDVIEILDAQRFAALRSLRELTAATRDLPQTRCAEGLAAERRIFELEGQLRWLDRVEALSSPQPPHPASKEA